MRVSRYKWQKTWAATVPVRWRKFLCYGISLFRCCSLRKIHLRIFLIVCRYASAAQLCYISPCQTKSIASELVSRNLNQCRQEKKENKVQKILLKIYMWGILLTRQLIKIQYVLQISNFHQNKKTTDIKNIWGLQQQTTTKERENIYLYIYMYFSYGNSWPFRLACLLW